MNIFSLLEMGKLRAAFKNEAGDWQVNPKVKEEILLAFKTGIKEKKTLGPFTFIDKNNLWPRDFSLTDEVRLVAGGVSVRHGAYVGKNVVIMPPAFVNVGAYVDDNSLIDSNALVGSCAQVGKRVHVSAGVQIGGVLEPVGDLPVIIEDDVFLGGQCGIFEGIVVKKMAVIAAGVIITKSTKIFDVVHDKVYTGFVPEGAVVVPGVRGLKGEMAEKSNLGICTPIIIKYRDEKTDKSVLLEEALR